MDASGRIYTEDEFAAMDAKKRAALVSLTAEEAATAAGMNRADRRAFARSLRQRGRGFTK